jgi:steroid delta-isomerase-like uncharacterized protein
MSEAQMSEMNQTASNKALARRWFDEVWNKGRSSAIEEMFDPEGLVWGLPEPGSALKGPAGFRPFYDQFRGAFPDIKIKLEDVIAEDDKVALRWTATVTHQGDHLGFKATQKNASFSGMSWVRVRNGKIAEGWNNWDVQGLMKQLGQA